VGSLLGAEDKPTGTDLRDGRSAAQEEQGSFEDSVGRAPLDLGHTASGGDGAASESDQTASDTNQVASDEDKAASDQEAAEGADQLTRDLASAHRKHATHLREEQSRARLRTGVSRDITADERTQLASTRDQIAEVRDASAKAREHTVESPGPGRREGQAPKVARDRQRAARDRTRAAADRATAAEERAESASDLTQSPGDRGPAADAYAQRVASGTPLAGGHLLAAISTSIVGILREHYGRGPMKAKTYALDDIIVVVMRGSGFTALEQTIMDSGEPDRVIAMREDFQRVMATLYKQTIEELTGRKVLAFLSQAHVEPDITMEIFFVDGPLEGFGAVEITEPVD
jgi:uncharacterized protein YbcI